MSWQHGGYTWQSGWFLDQYRQGNGDSKGFGKKSEGGVIADLPNGTILMEDDVLIGV